MYDTKTVTSPAEWKADGPAGSLRAVISTFDVRDLDGDVVTAGAFTEGQAVPLVWSHDWTRPIGRGVIHVEAKRAVFDGQLFLDTDDGLNAYKTIKQMGDLQEYSWGFQILEAEPVTVHGESARRITKAEVFEASPVLVGAAGRGRTRTLAIKSADLWAQSMSTAEHGEHAIAGVQSYAQRLRLIAESPDVDGTGRKEGRTLSGANRQRLQAVLDALAGLDGVRTDIADLLAATERAAAAEAAEVAAPPEEAGKAIADMPMPPASLLTLRQQFVTLDAYYEGVLAK